MPTIRELAAQAHAAAQQQKAAERMAQDTAALKASLDALLGGNSQPAENRCQIDGLTFTWFAGELLLVFTCPECQREVKGRRPINSMESLHLACEEKLPAHAPCDFYATKSKPQEAA